MTALLEVSGLDAHYGASHIVKGVDLTVAAGEVLAVLGRNGAGGTTLVHAITGMVRPSAGSVRLGGIEVAGAAPHRIARTGIALVPQAGGVMGSLSVEENLRIARFAPAPPAAAPWSLDDVYDLLPRLRERRGIGAHQLSGGEQQMLAIGRALLRNPLLLMDEPSEGLAPIVVAEIAALCRSLRERSMSFVLVEQNLGLGLAVADHVVVLDRGRVVYRDAVADFRSDRARAQRLLGVG